MPRSAVLKLHANEDPAGEIVAIIRPPVGFLPIEDAPDDGKAVLVTDGAHSVAAILKHTRYFDRRGGKWRYKLLWKQRSSEGGAALSFEPTGFRDLPDNWGFGA